MCRMPHRAEPAPRIARARAPDRSRSRARSGRRQERHRRAPAAPDTAPRAAARAQPAIPRQAAARGSIQTAASRIVARIEVSVSRQLYRRPEAHRRAISARISGLLVAATPPNWGWRGAAALPFLLLRLELPH